MRAVAISADHGVGVVEVDQPSIATTEVRLDVSYCGICGSDLHMVAGDTPVGQILGHEFSGVIAEVGADLTDTWSVGDRVAVMPVEFCGHCVACLDGGICETGLVAGPGTRRPGGFAQSVAIPGRMLQRLPDSVTDQGGAVAEPFAVAVRAVAKSEATPAEVVCVLGAGPVGFMIVVAAQARGLTRIVAVEPNAARREKMGVLGIPVFSPDEALEAIPAAMGSAPEVVIDCTGHPSGISLATALLAPRGRLIVVGITGELAPTDYMAVVIKELTIKGSLVYSPENFAEALEHLAAGRVPLDHIITGVVGLDTAQSVIDDLASGNSQHMKVLFKP
jgi:(R,R)-butanediol dehydrogenase/meso-butanediol dehydrogenase/diacetyl reductase